MTEQYHDQEEFEQPQTPPPVQEPSRPSSVAAMIDRVLATENPLVMGCLTDALNLWWRSQRLTGRGTATEADTGRLLRLFASTLEALPDDKRVSEFVPRNKLPVGDRLTGDIGDIVRRRG